MLGIKKQEIYRKKFNVKKGTALEVYNRTGSISVSGWDHDYLEVVAAKEINLINRYFPVPTVDVKTGDNFVVRNIYNSFLSAAVPVDSQIKIPKGMIVKHVQTSTGEIDLADVSGDVNAKTSTGAIKIDKVDGFITAETSTGAIDIEEVKGVYKARTSTGKISAEVPAIRDNLDLTTKTGEITVLLSDNINALISAGISSGKITHEDGLPLKISESTNKRLTGKLGKGDGKINIKTSSGSIRLKKLP